jgi:hypothetical protein
MEVEGMKISGVIAIDRILGIVWAYLLLVATCIRILDTLFHSTFITHINMM